MIGFLKPAKHKDPVSNKEVDRQYRNNRIMVFVGIFIGYAGYYLVRKNFALAKPALIEEGYSKAELGLAMSGIALAYGISKFVMGSVSDRSNPRFFLPLGLMVSASVMAVMGLWAWATSSVAIMFAFLFVNGWFQGMGWPASGKSMVHWFSHRERGTKMAIWNVAHNVGGGLVGPLAILALLLFGEWESILYFPAIFALIIAVAALFLIRDTPQSIGLPPIEKFKKDYPKTVRQGEKTLNAKELFLKHVLNNKLLWFIAFANAFIYLIRYGVLDWAPTFLSEVKGYDITESGWAYFVYEYAAIPGTILCGYLSDVLFKCRRALISMIYMALVGIVLLVYWLNPAGNHLIDNIALAAIGFLVYGPVMLIGVFALDLVSKKAAGTAAGFTGLFGYLGGALTAEILIGHVVEHYGWDAGFSILFAGIGMSILLLSFTIKKERTLYESPE